MRLKKKWVLISAIAITIALIAGTIGMVYAQTDKVQSGTSGNTLMARVATILGIDQQKLEDAFIQAQKEMDQEALTEQLKIMVNQGTITQEQADQYQQWWQSRPDMPSAAHVGGEMRLPGGFGGHGPGPMPPPDSTATAPSK